MTSEEVATRPQKNAFDMLGMMDESRSEFKDFPSVSTGQICSSHASTRAAGSLFARDPDRDRAPTSREAATSKISNLAGYNGFASLIACGSMLAKMNLSRNIDVRMRSSVE
jgi:hypothetical protein